MKLCHILYINHCVLRPETVFSFLYDSKQKLKKTNKMRKLQVCAGFMLSYNNFTCMNAYDLIKTPQACIHIVIYYKNPT